MAVCCKSMLSLSCLILPPFPAPGAISNGIAAVLTLETDGDTQESLPVACLLITNAVSLGLYATGSAGLREGMVSYYKSKICS